MDYLISFFGRHDYIYFPMPFADAADLCFLFAGQKHRRTKQTCNQKSAGFVLGFSIVFILLGAFAGTIGSVLKEHSTIVNVIVGVLSSFWIELHGYYQAPVYLLAQAIQFKGG
jgi:cytochrome c-type biogenesis protein